MTTATIQAKITELQTPEIESMLIELNKPWDQYLPEERKVKSLLLNEYETREGGEMVEALMDKLDEMVGEAS